MMNLNIHPGIFLIVCGLAASIVPKKIRNILLVAGPAFACVLSAQLTVGTVQNTTIFSWHVFHYLEVTRENYIFLFVFSVLALVAGIYAMHNESRLEAFASMGYAGSALCVTLAAGWLTLIFFWELMAITSLFLIWANHTRASNRAGFRYLLMHMLGGNLLLFGILLKVSDGQTLISCLTDGPHDAAFWLIFLGMAINAAIVPLHAWVPDAYPESTITGGVYLSSITTKITVLCLIRVFAGSQMLIWLGILMILYGACFALMENDIRRLLSYHIISQLGFMVADVGIGTHLAINGASALAFSNVLYKSLLFMCAGIIITATGIRKINQLGGLAKKMPLLCICFFIAALSIAGLPPFAGFTCKSLSMVAAKEAGMHSVELLMMLGSIGTALSIPIKMGYFIFFGKDKNIQPKPVPKNMYVAAVIGAALCILFGVCPNLAYRMLPYAMDYHPYTFHHILEYMQLVPAALLAFLMYIRKMEPHSLLTLDIDWFARVPFKKFIVLLTRIFSGIQLKMESIGRKNQAKIRNFAANPLRILSVQKKDEDGKTLHPFLYNEDTYRMPIGYGIAGVLVAGVIVAVFIVCIH